MPNRSVEATGLPVLLLSGRADRDIHTADRLLYLDS